MDSRHNRIRAKPYVTACVVWMTLLPGNAADRVSEYDVKAAFLLNFTKFVEWPAAAFASSDSPLALCVIGKDPFGRVLDDIIEGEAVSGRKLAVRRLDAPPAPQTCQVAFIGGSEKDVGKMLESLGKGALTVGEGEKFLREGGIITFVLDRGHIRFDINTAAAVKADLKLSSRLLTVARAIEK